MAKNRKLIDDKKYDGLQNFILILLAIGLIAFRFNEENRTKEIDTVTRKPYSSN